MLLIFLDFLISIAVGISDLECRKYSTSGSTPYPYRYILLGSLTNMTKGVKRKLTGEENKITTMPEEA
jgi:hypothetical protein